MPWWTLALAALGLAAPPAVPAQAPARAPGVVRGQCRDGRTWTSTVGEQTLMLGLINEVRADAARPPVLRHPLLDRLAMAHAADMACRDYFDHRSPDRLRLEQRLRRIDDGTLGAWSRLAEVIGTSDTPNRQLERWLGSRSHRRAVLQDEHDRVGVGLVRIAGSKYDTYWTVEFAALKPGATR